MSLVILPRQISVDQNGTPRVGAKLYVYNAGSSTPRTAYTTAAYSIPHTWPIESVSNGTFPAAYVNATGGDYKVVITDADDVPISTDDNIPVRDRDFDQTAIGEALYPQTQPEITAGVTPVNLAYPPYDARRYGAVGDDATVSTAALQNWLYASAGQKARLPAGTYLIDAQLEAQNATYIIGDGRENTYLKYIGPSTIPGGAMLSFLEKSAFRVSSLGFRCTNAVVTNATVQLHLEGCVYFEVDNISFGSSGASSGTNNITGLLCDQTTDGYVPPRGAGSIRDILYVVEPTDSGAASSRAVHIKGHTAQSMEHIIMEGEGNLEHAYYAVMLQNTSNCRIGSWQLRGAVSAEIKLVKASNTVIIGPAIAPAPSTGTGIDIDADSFDTLIVAPSWNFSSGTPLASLNDDGVRTTVLAPGTAGSLPVRGSMHGNFIITDTDSVASQNGVWEVTKNPDYDKSVIVARDSEVAPTGTKAFLKIERGGDSRALIQADINGASAFAVDSSGIVDAPVGLKLPLVATASLPAAGAGMDRRALIEDAGAGNRNLIVYAGGERFRFDGGSPF